MGATSFVLTRLLARADVSTTSQCKKTKINLRQHGYGSRVDTKIDSVPLIDVYR